MIRIDPTLNELEVLVVAEELKKLGVSSYDLLKGNECIWASYDRINSYYIFREGSLVDVQID
jgi:hypothetical protein